jgi:hypothetical protein
MDSPDKYGSEEGWRAASFDSRRHDKHRDIKALIDRQIVNQAAIEKAHNDKFMDDLVECAGPVVYAGLDKKGHAVGGSKDSAFRFNYDKWIESLGE